MKLSFALVTIIFLLACNGAIVVNSEKIPGYDLSRPDATLILPAILHEISGVTSIDSSTVGCIQDENGILFIYDMFNKKVKTQLEFGIDGDYEGITRVNQNMYVLRSDGTLFEISNYLSRNFKVRSFNTGVPAKNNEGLCYDADKNRLLIGCKGKIGKGSEFKDKRCIYGFDLKTSTLSKEPVYEFDMQNIKQFATKNNISLPEKKKKKEQTPVPDLQFKTSAIAIHPLNRQLYLLSAADHLLFIFNQNGMIENMVLLDPLRFNKAEGITFLENGDMLISNEGQDKKPTLLKFNYSN